MSEEIQVSNWKKLETGKNTLRDFGLLDQGLSAPGQCLGHEWTDRQKVCKYCYGAN